MARYGTSRVKRIYMTQNDTGQGMEISLTVHLCWFLQGVLFGVYSFAAFTNTQYWQ